MDGSSLPIGVSIDRNRKKLDRKKRPKSCYELKLYLQEKCPEASVIRNLHPGIRNVFVPRRPASARLSSALTFLNFTVSLSQSAIISFKGSLIRRDSFICNEYLFSGISCLFVSFSPSKISYVLHLQFHNHPFLFRYCILKCVSAEAREEVKSALHGQHVEPFRGVLKCSDTNVKVMKKLLGVNSKDLKEIRISQADIKHSKMLGQKTTSDVKFNSTQRELFVRYGVEPVSEGVKYESMKS